MVGPEPGLTRDPITVTFEHQGAAFDLVDTPGWMRRSAYERFDDSHGAYNVGAYNVGAYNVGACNVAYIVGTCNVGAYIVAYSHCPGPT